MQHAGHDGSQEEGFLFHLIDAVPQMVWVSGPDGATQYHNARIQEYSGLAPMEPVGDGWQQMVHTDDLSATWIAWKRAVGTGEPYECEYRLRRRDGAYRWHLSRASPQRDPEGRIIRWVGSCTDIDDLKRAEETLRENDRRKDEFLAMLGHELRNPLVPLRGVSAALRQNPDGPALERACGLLDRQVTHLTRLVDDLLDVARITRGKINLHTEPLDFSLVVARAVEMAGPLLEARGHELTTSLPLKPLRVRGDLTRLTQVLFNLLGNAAKYTDPGGRIWLTVEREGAEAVARVRDNGCGIAPAMLSGIFDAFTQGERGPDRSEGGLGLGLTLVRRLTELHGGTVAAHSGGVGRGSEFVVRLPALPAEDVLPSAPRAVPAMRRVDRVLVVDDNPDVAESIAMMLYGLAGSIRLAHDGPAALEVAREYLPEVVLMDIGLPGMDGWEAGRLLRQLPGLGKVLLAAVSGYGSEEDRRRSAAAGFDRHFVKPVRREHLEELFRSVPVGESN
jgi:PAS domain S-box-containing protein